MHHLDVIALYIRQILSSLKKNILEPFAKKLVTYGFPHYNELKIRNQHILVFPRFFPSLKWIDELILIYYFYQYISRDFKYFK